ncbi:lysis protein [Xenorhabdus sp. XENO-10]|uniref:Lysis protein n=1 Tax=Xenorhabdus yunnanensis TaxID=3025878 RepID=A0ABT5LMS8_9GAMM|nr:lysis protein [Xenorhabdus yunnanensis]MDC9591793.1 lysis protein [Xenorhabdus yunnanensis]
MRFNFTYGTVIALIVASVVAYFYRSGYKEQKQVNSDQATEIQQLTDTINYQNTHIEMLHELDNRHTQELAHAKTEIDRLHTASLAHPERVYIKAKCPVSKAAAPSGMDDADTARPTDTAIRNYWLLREHIATSEQMILGLQEYIKTQCQSP